MKLSINSALVGGITLMAASFMMLSNASAAPHHQARHGFHTYYAYGWKNGHYYYHRHYHRRHCWYDHHGIRHCTYRHHHHHHYPHHSSHWWW